MMRRTVRNTRLPSPALVLAAIALALSIGGGAFALGSANRQTKKIVTKVVRKLAPTLSVNHATTADTAGSVADKSVTLTKLAGADATGTVVVPSIGATSCTTLDFSASGAVPGDVALLSFQGGDPLDPHLIAEPLKVSAPGTLKVDVCNPTSSSSTGSPGVGYRVVTLR
jgi:hypothetical protein